MADDDEVFTVKEAAAYLKLHPKTVYRLLKQGNIPAQRVGGTWRLYRGRLRRWLAAPRQPQQLDSADQETITSGEGKGRE